MQVRLTRVDNSDGTNEQYTYNAESLRQKKVVGATTTNFLWDGDNVAQESNASLINTVRYTNLPGIWGGKFAVRQSGSGSSFYVPDFQGTTRQLTNISQTVTDTLLTDAWGREVTSTGTTVNPFKAFGQWGYYRDVAARLYVQARHLDVVGGRWMSRDPIGFDGGDENLYRYVIGSPVATFDPSGLQMVCKASCGPDVTSQVRNAMAKLRSKFAKLSLALKLRHCVALVNPIDLEAIYAWDIVELGKAGDNGEWVNSLAPPCARPRPPCNTTVWVSGQCYKTYVVNYVAFGVMCDLCGIENDRMHDLIFWWKARYGWADYIESVEWADVGYEGYPNSRLKPPYSRLTARCPNLCPNKDVPPKFRVIWAPGNEPFIDYSDY